MEHEYKFKIGDYVEILNGQDDPGYARTWNPDMKRQVGKICRIMRQDLTNEHDKRYLDGLESYKLDDGPDWWYDGRHLKAVQPPEDTSGINENDLLIYRGRGRKEETAARVLKREWLGHSQDYAYVVQKCNADGSLVEEEVKDHPLGWMAKKTELEFPGQKTIHIWLYKKNLGKEKEMKEDTSSVFKAIAAKESEIHTTQLCIPSAIFAMDYHFVLHSKKIPGGTCRIFKGKAYKEGPEGSTKWVNGSEQDIEKMILTGKFGKVV